MEPVGGAPNVSQSGHYDTTNLRRGLAMFQRTFCCFGVIGLLAVPSAFGQNSPSTAAQQLQVAATVTFLEGPTTDPEGNVFFTDLNGGRILKLSADGQVTTFREPSNRANGLLFESGRKAPGV